MPFKDLSVKKKYYLEYMREYRSKAPQGKAYLMKQNAKAKILGRLKYKVDDYKGSNVSSFEVMYNWLLNVPIKDFPLNTTEDKNAFCERFKLENPSFSFGNPILDAEFNFPKLLFWAYNPLVRAIPRYKRKTPLKEQI